MEFLKGISESYIQAAKACFQLEIDRQDLSINETRKEFNGDFTFVIFPLVKVLKKSPQEIGNTLGNWLITNDPNIVNHETIQGFLNLTLSEKFWIDALKIITETKNFGTQPANNKKVLVEFASPNTNKPLHLGHIRNILLGWSCSKILAANGCDVIRVQIINDRGIAICKSMLAWQKFGNGATPHSAGIKSDHFVGDFYVRFETEFKKEYDAFQQSPKGKELLSFQIKADQEADVFWKEYKNKYFNEYSQLGAEAKQMLLKWEAGEEAIIALWQKMNGWVYEGFDKTYEDLGVSFDKLYYESDTYLLGKKIIDKGLASGAFYREPDGSVWVNLEDAGMDRKILLRSDGSSVYMTQDLGTALQRYEDLGAERMIYTVADEQDYHFKVLFEILKRLGEPYAQGLHHLSYGMVDLPTGKMKSREGTVVDADDLVAEVIEEARNMSSERGEITALPKEEQEDILRKIGMAALKFFIIKVQPKKRMIFDPKESVDMQGQTGPYIQNAYVRIQSVKRKMNTDIPTGDFLKYQQLQEPEKTLIKHLLSFPGIVKEVGEQYDPSSIANYAYNLAKDFHRFYHDVRILNAETEEAKAFRSKLCDEVGNVLFMAFDLLGIEMPERM